MSYRKTGGTGEHVDVVVVGSGFGGSVSAYRLAEAGHSVVLLERGRAYPPGTFPRSPSQMGRAFWDPAKGLYGMFDVWSFRGCDSVVSSGLGGGSLIYANVLLRKDEEWFVKADPLPGGGYESWPMTRDDLEPHYEAVEAMLGAMPFPLDQPIYADTAKTRAMQDAAAELGLEWSLPPLGVSFAPAYGERPGLALPIVDREYGNLHGMPRRTCRLCGECNIGCNDGAKNSLDHTYLAAARHHGADLRTWHEVLAIRPRAGGGYEVDYVRHDPQTGPRDLPIHTIGCDRLILAAGTYGTSYLLLRSRLNFPGMSKALGTRFSGNGDLLSFLLRATDRSRTRPINASQGPVITSAIRLADGWDGSPSASWGHRGAYIEDGGYPGFVDWLVEGADVGNEFSRVMRFLIERLRAFVTHDTNLSAEISDLLGDGEFSGSSLPLLGMGRDVPDGRLRLRDGKLDVIWSGESSDEYFERLRGTMRRIADVLGAEYADSPVWFGRRVVTVHPLGGAPMGVSPDEGVCDTYGEVFGYPGLHIADGAAIPGPVGANPALTIAAMADRMCTRLLESTSMSVATRGGKVLDEMETAVTSLSFTEAMRGYFTAGTGDPLEGELIGRLHGEQFGFQLTITADDVDRFLSYPEHLARAEGWIDAAICGGRRRIERGWFNLFTPGSTPDRREMRYRLYFYDGENQPRTLSGWKDIHDGPPTRLWLDSSTLYARLLDGHLTESDEEKATVLGAGTLRIRPADLVQILTTFRASGPEAAFSLARFGKFFLGQLWDVYGPHLK
ncbi:FAD-dependent oxidoreductase [Rhizohabitans arisaemae]|uniref:FAD-dependent oxidoreductase n=1 Tax=Rhizohabitans arisaemae TaxID=2720610 RepID=UPI0024B0C376|nr:GMC family oxidoreductase [Rhizohabitans arisaemae]